MLIEFLRCARSVLSRYAESPAAASEILNDLYGSALKAYGVGRIVVSGREQVTLTVRGRMKKKIEAAGVSAGAQTIDLSLERIAESDLKKTAAALEKALDNYQLDGDGAHVWIVPDGYMAALSDQEKRWEREGGGYFSHESVCVQNTGPRAAHCELFVYFEAAGREVLRYNFEVPAERSIHLRLDKIPGLRGEPFIPKSTPVGYKIISRDTPVVVQGSRILTSGRESEFAAFGTTMAWMAK
jgi:hypothetical protein